MNFQTSKRIMCCLMAALILCCAVVRPIEANASAIAAGVLAGAYASDVIISGMIALGVTLTSMELVRSYVDTIVDELPKEETYTVAGLDEPMVRMVNVDGIYYVSQNIIEWLRDKLLYSPTVELPVYKYDYLGTPTVNGDPISSSDILDYMLGTDRIPETSAALRTVNNYRCYVVNFTGGTSHNGFYYFYGTKPSLTWEYNVYVGYLGKTYDKILSLTLPSDASFASYNFKYDYIETGPNKVYFPDVTSYSIASTYGRLSTSVVPGQYVYADFTPKIDTDYDAWIKTGIWVVITDEPETGDGNDNDDDKLKPKPYVPLRTNDPKTPDEAQSGDGADEVYTKPNGYPIIYDEPIDDGTGDNDGPAANPADYDDTNLLEQLRLFGIDLKNGFNDMVNKLLSLINICSDILKSSNNILEAITGLADLFIPKLITAIKATWNDFIDLLWQKFSPIVNLFLEGLPAVLQKLADWLKPLMDYLLEGMKNLFIPREGFFDSKIEELKAKFPFFNSIVGTVPAFKSFILSLGSTPPVIYIDLPSATGSWYWGARTIFLDLRWYAQYKPTMDAILSGFLWLWFIWRMILAFPGIIQGTQGFWNRPQTTEEKGLVVASNWYDRR